MQNYLSKISDEQIVMFIKRYFRGTEYSRNIKLTREPFSQSVHIDCGFKDSPRMHLCLTDFSVSGHKENVSPYDLTHITARWNEFVSNCQPTIKKKNAYKNDYLNYITEEYFCKDLYRTTKNTNYAINYLL